MTQDEIIRMAREAGFTPLDYLNYNRLERFAALVAAHKREQWKKESEAKGQLALAELHYGVKCK